MHNRGSFVLVATMFSLSCLRFGSAIAHADSSEVSGAVITAKPERPSPRLKASYRLFAISGLQGGQLWLNGAQVDAYALSRRWVRVGVELEGGGGGATFSTTPVRLSYGLLGLTAGVQYPARITPFVEGRFVGGVLSGQLEGTLTIGSSSYSGQSATTWMYGGGIESGIEAYVYGRTYLSLGLGWMRSTWHGIDVLTMMANPSNGMAYKNLTGDTFTLKIGIGI
jgi:hypothetical protein